MRAERSSAVEGSGTGTTATRHIQSRDHGGIHRRPEVVYSAIVPMMLLVTNRFDPDTAMPTGLVNPEIRDAFTVAPTVGLESSLEPRAQGPFDLLHIRSRWAAHFVAPPQSLRDGCGQGLVVVYTTLNGLPGPRRAIGAVRTAGVAGAGDRPRR